MLLDHLFKLGDMPFFVFLQLFPKGGTFSAVFCVFTIVALNAPEALMFLCCLVEQVIYVIIQHYSMYCLGVGDLRRIIHEKDILENRHEGYLSTRIFCV